MWMVRRLTGGSTLSTRALRRVSTVAALLVTPVLALAAPAAAAPSVSTPAVETPTRTVEVVGSPRGFTAPATRRAGITTFRVSTTDPAGIRLGLFRLNPGVRLDRYLVHLRTALTGNRAEAVAAGRKVVRQATLLGGASAVPGQPATLTQVLSSGRYHLIDYEDIEEGAGRPVAVRQLTVTDGIEHDVPDRPDALVRMIETPSGPRFDAPRTLRPDDSLLVTNLSGQVDEAIFMPVRPGTTSADVQAFFEARDRGEWPPYSPFIGAPRGMPVLSPGRAAVLRPALTPGDYALVTWVLDLDSGAGRAAAGMHALVSVA
jgi:hypothetical protein